LANGKTGADGAAESTSVSGEPHLFAPWAASKQSSVSRPRTLSFIAERLVVRGVTASRSGHISRFVISEHVPSVVRLQRGPGKIGPSIVIAHVDVASDVLPWLSPPRRRLAGHRPAPVGLIADSRTVAAAGIAASLQETAVVVVSDAAIPATASGSPSGRGSARIINQLLLSAMQAALGHEWGVVFVATLDASVEPFAPHEADDAVRNVVHSAAKWGYDAPATLVLVHAQPLLARAAVAAACGGHGVVYRDLAGALRDEVPENGQH
jgi:hypothetical protein